MHEFFKALLAFAVLSILGCGGNRFSPVVKEEPKVVLSTKASKLETDVGNIITDEDFTQVTLKGESGDRVFINDKLVGTILEDGSLTVTFDLKDLGDYTFKVYSENVDGVKSEEITLNVIKKEKKASLGTIKTEGEASSLTVSQGGVVFIAEKEKGVEVISIGYSDIVHSDLLATISDINAQDVVLSDDEEKLFIKDDQGGFHVIDISDVNNPKEIALMDTIEKNTVVYNKDQTIRYRIASCGLVGEDVSNPSNYERLFLLKDKTIKDIVLVNDDSEMLLANGKKGLVLYDLSDPKAPLELAQKDLGDDTSGLSLLKNDGILFVANGESGVEIFDLNVLLLQMKN